MTPCSPDCPQRERWWITNCTLWGRAVWRRRPRWDSSNGWWESPKGGGNWPAWATERWGARWAIAEFWPAIRTLELGEIAEIEPPARLIIIGPITKGKDEA